MLLVQKFMSSNKDIRAFKYVVVDEGIEIVGCDNTPSNLVIPARLNGEKVVGIGEMAFWGGNIQHLELPQYCKYIGNNAFGNNLQLQSVEFNSELLIIGNSAFCGCKSLQELILPNQLEQIGEYAFAWCKDLCEIMVGDKLKVLRSKAFCFCECLQEIVLPASLKIVGDSIFTKASEQDKTLIICESPSQPDGWDKGWNDGNDEEVIWGVV